MCRCGKLGPRRAHHRGTASNLPRALRVALVAIKPPLPEAVARARGRGARAVFCADAPRKSRARRGPRCQTLAPAVLALRKRVLA